MSWLPCGTYHEFYKQDHSWWQTRFVKGKMILLGLTVFLFIPLFAGNYWLSVMSEVAYTALGALGVQLLIGFCGQITLGHAAFLAVGAYTSALLMLQAQHALHLDHAHRRDRGRAVVGLLRSALGPGQGLLSDHDHHGRPVHHRGPDHHPVRLPGGRQGPGLQPAPGTLRVGPWVIESDRSIYYLLAVVTVLMTVALANLLRSKVGRAWVAIRDNDIAAEAMGINIIYYKLLAFFVAGFIGGVAGSAGLSRLSAISPEHFPWFWSLWLVGVILIGGAGSLYGVFFGSLFMVLVMEGLKLILIPLGPIFPQLAMKFLFLKEATFGIAIAAFLIYEPNGLAYRWWQTKNYFNLWPFSYRQRR